VLKPHLRRRGRLGLCRCPRRRRPPARRSCDGPASTGRGAAAAHRGARASPGRALSLSPQLRLHHTVHADHAAVGGTFGRLHDVPAGGTRRAYVRGEGRCEPTAACMLTSRGLTAAAQDAPRGAPVCAPAIRGGWLLAVVCEGAALVAPGVLWNGPAPRARVVVPLVRRCVARHGAGAFVPPVAASAPLPAPGVSPSVSTAAHRTRRTRRTASLGPAS
jgi:hypothetical protein